MILLTDFYVPEDPKRYDEIQFCLFQNINNRHIDKIVLFLEEDIVLQNSLNSDKLLKIIGPRKSFMEMQEWVRDCELVSDDIFIIANADIYLTDNICIIQDCSMENKLIVLTRWNLTEYYEDAKFEASTYSQDVWIFKKGQVLDIPYYLGTPGIDNRIARVAHDSDLIVVNPSLSVHCIHVHMDSKRNYHGKVPGPYMLIKPSMDLSGYSEIRLIDDFTKEDLEW